MKIVHIAPSLVKGGGERALVDLANWQAAQGHRVSVVAGWKTPEHLLREDLRPDIAVEYVGAGGRARYIQALSWVWRKWRWLSENDVVHAHLTYGSVVATLIYLLRLISGRGPAIVETYHAVGMPIPGLERWVHAQMLKARDASVFMADDAYWHPFCRVRPFPRTALILNGLADARCRTRSDPEVRDYRRVLGTHAAPRLVVGTIGRLVAERRPDLVLAVFGLIAAARGDEVRFIFVGDGPEKETLHADARRLRIEDACYFPGLALDPGVPIALMDVYLTVNVGTVTGLAGVQAALSGLPVVGIQLDREYRSTEHDWIWSSNDVDAVAAEATRLLDDAAARKELAAKQRAYAEQHLTVDKMGAAYADLYSSLARRG